MIALDEALRRLDEACAPRLAPAEPASTREAAGRVLAADAVSRLDIPPFDRVTMDGYAIPPAPEGRLYEVAGEVRAGQAASAPLRPGAALKVMTGCVAPPGTGRVVMVEKARERDGLVEILDGGGPRNVAARGEDVRVGQVVVPAGARLTPRDIAGLLACGVAEVSARAVPRVTVMATGDELVGGDRDLPPGAIYDANTPLLAGLLAAHGYAARTEPPVPDDPAATRDALAAALAVSDLVVLTGGVSMGDHDHVPGAMKELGLEIVFDRVAVKPGKPATLAAGPAGLVLGLPGNPVSAFVGCHLYVLPALSRLQGRRLSPRFLELRLAEAFGGGPERRLRLLPARLDAEARVVPLAFHSSGHLHSLLAAEGLVRIDPGVSGLRAGDRIDFWPLTPRAYLSHAGDAGTEVAP